MNTDTMTISGETIDYGPCAFLDAYEPLTAFSSIDHRKRYAYANHPPIAQWNLARLAESLLDLIDADTEKAIEIAKERISAFKAIYEERYAAMMARKLGLAVNEEGDAALAADLLGLMREQRADYTNTFRVLADGEPIREAADPAAFDAWRQRWQARIEAQPGGAAAAHEIMAVANPVYIPRNHMVEAALHAATEAGDLAPFQRLLDAVSDPYARRTGFEDHASPMPMEAGPYRTFCGT